jgi:hypothetical protein
MTEQNITSWIEQEKQELGTQTETVFEKLPALKLQENKLTEVSIDFSEKFKTYEAVGMKGEPVKKAIIPVSVAGTKMNWWLNKKNPTYRELLDKAAGKTTLIVKIMQTGNQANTKYIIVE